MKGLDIFVFKQAVVDSRDVAERAKATRNAQLAQNDG